MRKLFAEIFIAQISLIAFYQCFRYNDNNNDNNNVNNVNVNDP